MEPQLPIEQPAPRFRRERRADHLAVESRRPHELAAELHGPPVVVRLAGSLTLPAPSTTRTRQPPALRRDETPEAALRAIRRHGFAVATVCDVAREARVPTGLIHHYFASFPELLAAAFETTRALAAGRYELA